MSTAEPIAASELLTVEEFLRLPDDGIHRELIRGQVRIHGVPEPGMTYRNRFHSEIEANFVYELKGWLRRLPEPRGKILCGEVGFRLDGTPTSLVGIDVAYASAELIAATAPKQRIFDGSPLLAVEILSPSDTQEGIVEKLDLYLQHGAVVWIVDPDVRIVRVHRPGREPEMFTASQDLTTEPELPGFRVPVSQLIP